jgi:D-alanine transaminase
MTADPTSFACSQPSPVEATAAANLANLNGVQMPLGEVKVPALDRGFLFGDAVYEVLRVYRGKPWLEEGHFARLARSLEEVRIRGVDVARLRQRMHETLTASRLGEATIYIQITRGTAPVRSHPFPANATPLELLWVAPYSDTQSAEGRRIGVSVALQPDLRWGRCDIKSTNLLGNVMALQAAKEAGCVEAVLYLPDGWLTECTHSSFFAVLDGRLITTPLSYSILPGVTRDLVLHLASRLQLPVDQRNLHRDELPKLAEFFLTGTTTEVMAVVRIDNKPVADGRPGPITRRLQDAYRQEVESA